MTDSRDVRPPNAARKVRRVAFGVLLLAALTLPLVALVLSLVHASPAPAPQSCVVGRHQCPGPIPTTVLGN